VSWDELLNQARSFRNLFAMAKKGGVNIEAEMQEAMR